MKKIIIVLFAISTCLLSCETQAAYNSEERSDIVEWAKHIAMYEKDAKLVVNNYYELSSDLVSRYPTNEELNQLTTYYNLINYIYNKLGELNPPPKASSVHKKYVENYAKVADSILFYTISVRKNDITYFEKSVSASKEANRIGDEAYKGFVDLLDNYSISCSEIDFCE